METRELTELGERVRAVLAGPLPGRAFQDTMVPPSRRGQSAPPEPFPSAVLIAIVDGSAGPSLVLVEREAGGPHGGQIAFPGGKKEHSDSSIVETALREAHEEIGLDSGKVEVLGLLSPLTISVSRFLVQPVVGLVAEAPVLKPNPGEIASIFEVPIAELLRPENRQEREILVRGEGLLVPCYVFGEVLVWGATAMMLRELEEVLRRATRGPRPLAMGEAEARGPSLP
jgi:8-oxo-dGTP pyrophosphatase MutT (NUDIX family)